MARKGRCIPEEREEQEYGEEFHFRSLILGWRFDEGLVGVESL